jgi:nitroreductase/NAD-dependent dihydropyrimidine dehydrogenase PreA subunit
MLNFDVDLEKCIGCGQCASDCPAMIIAMDSNLPIIAEDVEKFCIGCMHCVAVCSEGAVAILGYSPEEGADFKDSLPGSVDMELLIKGRRAIRNYQDKNVEPAVIDKMLEVASHAPSGHNDRGILFTVVDDKGTLFDLREEAFEGLQKLIDDKKLPEGMEMFVDIIEAWKSSGKDILFRGAPHLLITSSSKENAAPLHDCIIALTTFEIYAQSCSVGTIWNGLAMLTISELLPELKTRLGVPENHQIGYVMGFGYPALKYQRTIERGAPKINRVVKI